MFFHDPYHRRSKGSRPGFAGTIRKLDGTAIRIPTPNVSMIDFTFYTKKNINAANINAKIKEACLNSFKNIVQFNELPLVSIDFNIILLVLFLIQHKHKQLEKISEFYHGMIMNGVFLIE